MKRIFAFILVIIFSFNLLAERKKVGLVLAGGGAKGVSHIGVIRVLEEAGIPIDYIAGTSMGAIIGGLYAIGYTVEEMDSLVRKQDWVALLGNKTERTNKSLLEKEADDKYILSLPLTKERKIKIPTGMMSGQSVYNLLSELTIGYHDSIDFKTLPIPFSCVAYDAVTGKEVVLSSGYLPQAIRASMAIPGAFTPINANGMVLVDGGMINNMPADVVKAMGADIIICVDLASEQKSADELQSVTALADQITNFMGREAYEKNRKLADLYIHPNLKPYTAASFSKGAVDTLIVRGEAKAREQWFEISNLKRKIGVSDQEGVVYKDHRPASLDSIKIKSIYIQGIGPKHAQYAKRFIDIKENSTITSARLHQNVASLQGSGMFSDINYKLNNQNSEYDLTFFMNEKSNNSINFGFRFDTEEMAAILLNLTLNSHSMGGSGISLTGRLSTNPYVKIKYSYGNTALGNIGLSYLYKYNDVDLYDHGKKRNNITFGLHKIDLQLATWNIQNVAFRAGANFEYFDYKSVLFARDEDKIVSTPGRFFNYYARLSYESLDKLAYPTSGMLARAGYNLTTDNFATYQKSTPFSALNVNFKYVVPMGRRVALIPEIFGRVIFGKNAAYPYWNYLGGDVAGRYMDQQIPFIGIQRVEITENKLAVARLESRVRMWESVYASILINYAWNSDQFSTLLNDQQYWGAGIKLAYDTPIGPISLLIDRSNQTKKTGFYFSLGRYF